MTRITKLFLIIINVFLVLQAPAFAAQKPFHLLITSFDPYHGSSKNNTQAIAAQIQNILPNKLDIPIEIKVCNLPVVYDVAANQAMRCVNDFLPDAVISLGEGDCTVRLETAATNWDNDIWADNEGQIRRGSIIIPGGPQRTGFIFPIPDLFCAFQPDSPPNTIISHDPMEFVCNNTAYHLSETLKKLHIAFTLIHVPNAECPAKQADPITNAQTIATMLVPAIQEIANDSFSFNNNMAPATRREAEIYYLDALSGLTNTKKQCVVNFSQELLATYAIPNNTKF